MRRVLLGVALVLVGCSGATRDSEESPPPPSGTIHLAGAELSYVIEGSGPACLVIGSAAYYPGLFSDDLADHLRLVYVDLRHFAPSDSGFDPEGLTRQTFADDIEHVREALSLDRVTVIGHSIHGNFALDYAARYPDHVERVVVIGSPPVGLAKMGEASRNYWADEASAERKQQLEANWAARGAEIEQMSREESFVATYVTNGPYYWADPAFDCTELWKGVYVNVPVSDRVFGPMFAEYGLPTDPPIDVPVLVVMGRHDYVVPHALWDTELDKLPHHDYLLLDGSGHTPQFEQPDAFDAKLLEFMGVPRAG